MANAVATYAPAQIKLSYTPGYADAPTLALTGFGEDSIVNIVPIGDAFENSEGADGLMDRVNRGTRSYDVTITLKQTSVSNADLIRAIELEKESEDGLVGKLAITPIDGSKTISGDAWITTPATMGFSRKMSMREWKFTLTNVSGLK